MTITAFAFPNRKSVAVCQAEREIQSYCDLSLHGNGEIKQKKKRQNEKFVVHRRAVAGGHNTECLQQEEKKVNGRKNKAAE